jgi:hypothetical protein
MGLVREDLSSTLLSCDDSVHLFEVGPVIWKNPPKQNLDSKEPGHRLMKKAPSGPQQMADHDQR